MTTEHPAGGYKPVPLPARLPRPVLPRVGGFFCAALLAGSAMATEHPFEIPEGPVTIQANWVYCDTEQQIVEAFTFPADPFPKGCGVVALPMRAMILYGGHVDAGDSRWYYAKALVLLRGGAPEIQWIPLKRVPTGTGI